MRTILPTSSLYSTDLNGGGHWKARKDYQHFELPDDKVKELYPNNK